MRLPAGFAVGTATHTGRVRRSNEDDYLVVAPDPDHLLLVLADGMGGAVGGAEASRLASRTLASGFLSRSGDPRERMRGAYAAACRSVYERSRSDLQLRDMGTTLTTVWLGADRAVVGHVGDTRAVVRTDRGLEQWTDDHAVRGAESYLTRCVGGGQETENPDVFEEQLGPGERLVLMTDGVWGVVSPLDLEVCLRAESPQEAADRLVAAAVGAGGPDNATVLVVDRLPERSPGDAATWRRQDLPSQEAEVREEPSREPPALRPSRWVWVAWSLAVVLMGLIAAREWLGFDPVRAAVLRYLSGS